MSGRIALFFPSLRGGGAERVMMNLARAFADRGFGVDIVLVKAEGPYLAQTPVNVRLVDLNSRRALYSLPGLLRYLRRERPRVMLCTPNRVNIIALWARRIVGVPKRLVVREATTIGISASNEPTLLGRLRPFLMRPFYRWADMVVAISRGVAEDIFELTGLPKEKLMVIYNPAVTPDLFAKAEEPLDHPWFRNGEPPVILGVGRLAKVKDFHTLIHSFARVRKRRSVRLMILGEGKERSDLEALVRELNLERDVTLPGFAENPFKYMRRAALFAQSSRWEGFGLVLVEAMALGTPVVSTNCPGGPSEILEDGKWGRLAPVGDSEALAEAMAATLDQAAHPDVAARARDFGLEKIVEEYLKAMGISEP